MGGRSRTKAVRCTASRLGTLPVFAEDLGVITEQVEQLRDVNGFPGMKVAQFGFSVGEDGFLDAGSVYLLIITNIRKRPIPALMTTILQEAGMHPSTNRPRIWFADILRVPMMRSSAYGAGSISLACQVCRHSHTGSAKLGSEARMNLPGTCGDHNWSWRVKMDVLSDSLADANAVMLRLFARASV